MSDQGQQMCQGVYWAICEGLARGVLVYSGPPGALALQLDCADCAIDCFTGRSSYSNYAVSCITPL